MATQRRHVLSHLAIYLAARGVPGLLGFVAIPLFTRLLSPADYGRYALVIGSVAMANALLFQWMRLSLVRYLSSYEHDSIMFKSSLASMSAALVAVLGTGVGIFCAFPAAAPWRAVAIACWILLAVQAFYEMSCEYSRASIRPGRYMVLQIIKALGFVVVGGALAMLMGTGKWWAPLGGLIAGMALAIAWSWHADWRGIRLHIDRDVLAKVCQYGIPLSITVALSIVISTSDRFLIAWMKGAEAAGQYSVAVDFTAQTLTLLMMTVSTAIFPLAVRAYEREGSAAAAEHMRHNASLLLAIGVPSVIGLTVLSGGVAHCFLGAKFRDAAVTIIPLIALGSFLAGLKAYHFDAAFQFAHRTIHQIWIVLVAAAINVVLNLLAVPRWGINGAAAASVLAYCVSILLTVIMGRRYFALPLPLWDSAKVLLAGLAMAALIYPLRHLTGTMGLALAMLAGATLYGVCLVATDFFDLRTHLLDRLHSLRMHRSPNQIGVAATMAAAEVRP